MNQAKSWCFHANFEGIRGISVDLWIAQNSQEAHIPSLKWNLGSLTSTCWTHPPLPRSSKICRPHASPSGRSNTGRRSSTSTTPGSSGSWQIPMIPSILRHNNWSHCTWTCFCSVCSFTWIGSWISALNSWLWEQWGTGDSQRYQLKLGWPKRASIGFPTKTAASSAFSLGFEHDAALETPLKEPTSWVLNSAKTSPLIRLPKITRACWDMSTHPVGFFALGFRMLEGTGVSECVEIEMQEMAFCINFILRLVTITSIIDDHWRWS